MTGTAGATATGGVREGLAARYKRLGDGHGGLHLNGSVVGCGCVEVEERGRRREVPLLVAGVSTLQTLPHSNAALARQYHIGRSGSSFSFVDKAGNSISHAPVLRIRRIFADEIRSGKDVTGVAIARWGEGEEGGDAEAEKDGDGRCGKHGDGWGLRSGGSAGCLQSIAKKVGMHLLLLLPLLPTANLLLQKGRLKKLALKTLTNCNIWPPAAVGLGLTDLLLPTVESCNSLFFDSSCHCDGLAVLLPEVKNCYN
jgi:hypothetical protein